MCAPFLAACVVVCVSLLASVFTATGGGAFVPRCCTRVCVCVCGRMKGGKRAYIYMAARHSFLLGRRAAFCVHISIVYIYADMCIYIYIWGCITWRLLVTEEGGVCARFAACDDALF